MPGSMGGHRLTADRSSRGEEVSPADAAGRRRYLGLVALAAMLAVAGYLGYVLFPRFDLSAAEGAGLLGLAAMAGVASFFSPCSFPLLVALLGGRTAAASDTAPRPVLFGTALAFGAAVFMILAGSVIALGGEALFSNVTFASPAGIAIRSIVGLVLIGLGLAQTGIVPISMHGVSRFAQPMLRTQARLRRERPVAGFALFGFGYVLAGFG